MKIARILKSLTSSAAAAPAVPAPGPRREFALIVSNDSDAALIGALLPSPPDILRQYWTTDGEWPCFVHLTCPVLILCLPSQEDNDLCQSLSTCQVSQAS